MMAQEALFLLPILKQELFVRNHIQYLKEKSIIQIEDSILQKWICSI